MEWFAAWEGAAVVLGIVLAGLAAAAAIAGLAFAVSWLVAIAPLLLMIALLGVILLLVEDIISAFEGKDSLTGRFFKEAARVAKEVWGDFIDWLDDKWFDLSQKAREYFSFIPGIKSAAQVTRERGKAERDKLVDDAIAKNEERFRRLESSFTARLVQKEGPGVLFENGGRGMGMLSPDAPQPLFPSNLTSTVPDNPIIVNVNGAVDPLTTGRVVTDAIVNKQ